jgi:hypothetical protein
MISIPLHLNTLSFGQPERSLCRLVLSERTGDQPRLMGSGHIHRLRSVDLTWRELGDRIVILDLQTSSYLTVEASGTTVWKLLQAGATTDDLAEALCGEYDVDHETAVGDIEEFLGDLSAKGLLASIEER